MLVAALVLSACGPGGQMKDGGPCSYLTVYVNALVVEAQKEGDAWRFNVVLDGSSLGGDTIPLHDLVHWPVTDSLKAHYGLEIGARVPMEIEEITKGACTPMMGTLVDPKP